MDIRYYINRFENRIRTHVGKVNAIKKIWYFIDYFFAFLIHGASINDYFSYEFFKLRHNGRSEYVTYRRFHKIQRICNQNSKEIEKCRNKIAFNTYFSKYLGRKWLDVSNSSFEEFKDFITKLDTVFVKAVDSYRGMGVESYATCNIDIKDLFIKLSDDKETRYILEEKIEQRGELADFHRWSINTLRLTTVYNTVEDSVNIISANLRTGRNKDHRDNLHSGGIACQIDIETGIIFSSGFDSNNLLYLQHPDSLKQFIGFKIPYWQECKNFIIEVAKMIPTVRYIGWDIVSKGDGTFILIEGNDNADHDLQQLNNKGLWRHYKKIMNGMK